MQESQISLENAKLISQVKKLEHEIEELQNSLQAAKESIDIDATKAPIKLYIVGKYIGFNTENGIIELFVEGNRNFYTLEQYGSSRLPFPDARVLIFNIEGKGNSPFILGFDGGRLILPSQHFAANLVAINFLDSQLTLNTKLYGNIMLTPSKEFLQNKHLKHGDTLLIREIAFATQKYFVLVNQEQQIQLDKNKMYSFLSTLIN